MVLWFAGLALVIVWWVFRDPAIDGRLVVIGALLPDAVDGPLGGAGPLHAVLAPVAVLALVMLATIGRRRLRRQLLALPIGMFLHLVLDGAWALTGVFWWPVSGAAVWVEPLPSISRGAVNIVLELLGAAALAWYVVRFGLTDPERRRVFARTGRLDRSLATPPQPPPTC